MTKPTQADIAAAYARGRADAATIFTSTEAKGRRHAASLLGANADVTVADAARLLAAMPAKNETKVDAAQPAKGETFQQRIQSGVDSELRRRVSPRG